ncbi:MAG: hypothetical protein KGL39_43740 [Patescibacteria group bacterium]|nr:hypothetical protein [Patescibacteria group bacterium]
MPRTIRADGRIITVPDDATPEEINEIVGPAASSPQQPQKSLRESLTERRPLQSDTPMHALEDTLSNIGSGALRTLLYPKETAKGLVDFAVRSSPPGVIADIIRKRPTIGQEIVEDVVKNPYQAIPEMIGQAAALGGAEGLARGATKFPEASAKAITKTGPSSVGELVKETKTANEAADAYSKARAAVETAREKARTIGNQKFNAINEQLNIEPADTKQVINSFVDATGKIKGSETQPSIFKDIERKIERGEGFSYEDLQGYYSELGSELSKGSLPGDVYAALDTMHEAIGDEMQKIANKNGLGAELKDARQYWRRMKQAFGNQKPVNDVANTTLRSIAPKMTEQEALANRIRLMASFDPEITKVFDDLKEKEEMAKGTNPVTPGETRKINASDIRAKKLNTLTQEGIPRVRKWGTRAIQYGVGLKALWDLWGHNVEGVPRDLGFAAAGYGATEMFARMLEKPEVQKMLTSPTAEDIQQIPPELRGKLGPMLDAAKAKGIKVDPRLYAIAKAPQHQ